MCGVCVFAGKLRGGLTCEASKGVGIWAGVLDRGAVPALKAPGGVTGQNVGLCQCLWDLRQVLNGQKGHARYLKDL